MSVSLSSITLAAISIGPSVSMPIIKVVLKDVNNPTELEMRDIFTQVYNQCGRGSSTVAYFGYPVEPLPDPSLIPNGSVTYGLDVGFKLVVNNDTSSPGNPTSYNLFFNNINVCNIHAFSGYSAYETAFGMIFVDENNRVYTGTGPAGGEAGYTAFSELYDTFRGVGVFDHKMWVATVLHDHDIYIPNGIITPDHTVADITDYILHEIDPEDDDPYVEGEEESSGGGGGEGNFDASSDIIDLPGLPSISAIDTGFVTLFVPSAAQLRSLSQYLWTDLLADVASGQPLDSVVQDMKKIVANPFDAILGLSIVPVSIPLAGTKDVKMYGAIDSGISMSYASSQYVTVDCGTLHINEYWGAYLDYAPYTKVTSLYLPYVGVVTVNVDEIMGKSLRVVYHIDILSGQCIAYIVINGSVEYQYQGHCAISIPVTSADFSNVITSGLNILSGLSNIASSAVGGFAMGGAAGAAVGAAASAVSAAPAVAGNVMNMKPDIKSGGAIGGMGGMLSVQKPYLIAIRPRQCVPAYQNRYTGYPANRTLRIRECSGYTEFEKINLDGITLTSAEKEELEAILKGGAYL